MKNGRRKDRATDVAKDGFAMVATTIITDEEVYVTPRLRADESGKKAYLSDLRKVADVMAAGGLDDDSLFFAYLDAAAALGIEPSRWEGYAQSMKGEGLRTFDGEPLGPNSAIEGRICSTGLVDLGAGLVYPWSSSAATVFLNRSSRDVALTALHG